MTRQQRFVTIVQTLVLINEFTIGKKRSVAILAVAIATAIPEEHVPRKMGDEADALVRFMMWLLEILPDNEIAPIPDWFVDVLAEELSERDGALIDREGAEVFVRARCAAAIEDFLARA